MPAKAKRPAAYSEPPVLEGWKDKKITAVHEDKAKRALRRALADEGVSYPQLAAKLRRMGIEISDGGLENKISRGSFTAGFLFQCLGALGVKSVDIEG
jgi:hypothetical protein